MRLTSNVRTINNMRRIFHFSLAIVGLIVWGIANFFYSFCIYLAIFGDRLIPGTTFSNCWAFSLSRWWKYGGYIAIRKSDGNKFLGFLPLPHIIWIKSISWDHAEIEHLIPNERKKTSWFPWYAIYFDGYISNNEKSHKAMEVK